MTAEALLLILLLAAAGVAAGLGALILAALGQTGVLVILGLAAAAVLVWRHAAARLAAEAEWSREDLRDEWRPG